MPKLLYSKYNNLMHSHAQLLIFTNGTYFDKSVAYKSVINVEVRIKRKTFKIDFTLILKSDII